MTKKELVEVIAKENNITKKKSEEIINSIIDLIIYKSKTESVQISGFGTFELKTNKARSGVNPFTKEPMEIKESNTVKFKPSKAFKDELN